MALAVGRGGGRRTQRRCLRQDKITVSSTFRPNVWEDLGRLVFLGSHSDKAPHSPPSTCSPGAVPTGLSGPAHFHSAPWAGPLPGVPLRRSPTGAGTLGMASSTQQVPPRSRRGAAWAPLSCHTILPAGQLGLDLVAPGPEGRAVEAGRPRRPRPGSSLRSLLPHCLLGLSKSRPAQVQGRGRGAPDHLCFGTSFQEPSILMIGGL